MDRAMIQEINIPQTYWVEAIHTIIHILHKENLRPSYDKTPYELWHGQPGSIKYFKMFDNKCYIKSNDDKLGNFDAREDEGIFLGYSTKRKGYICYNKRLHKIVDYIDVRVDEELSPKSKQTWFINPSDHPISEEEEEHIQDVEEA